VKRLSGSRRNDETVGKGEQWNLISWLPFAGCFKQRQYLPSFCGIWLYLALSSWCASAERASLQEIQSVSQLCFSSLHSTSLVDLESLTCHYCREPRAFLILNKQQSRSTRPSIESRDGSFSPSSDIISDHSSNLLIESTRIRL